jgi:hypothetical protein
LANDTFRGIAGKVLLRCPSASLTLAMDWTQSAFRDIVERRRWSWLFKKGQLVTAAQYSTGTATTVVGSQTITINAPGVVANAHVGLQFRIGVSLPILTITNVDLGLNTYTVDQPWEPTNQTAQNFSVYTAYVAVPSDFHAFFTVIDPAFAQPIPFDSSVAQLDNIDPQRAAAGSPPKGLAFLDYFNNLPRYELWPHQRNAAVYPMVYESRPVDPFDTNAVVPFMLPSDIILERALMYCSAWPGASAQDPNPYFNKQSLALHQGEYEKRIAVIEKQDNEHMQQNIWYQQDQMRRTPVVSGNWLQSHDMGGL